MSPSPGAGEFRAAPPPPVVTEAPKAAPANPNREILKRPLTHANEADHVMAVVARTKQSAIETGAKHAEPVTPLDIEIGSYGFLTQLQSGDKFNPPFRIELNGTTYVIGEVFTNQDRKVMLRSPTTGTAVELADVVGQTSDRIRGLLPAQAEGEPAQISFVRAFMESKRQGGQPVDQAVVKEAARSCGIPLSEDIVQMAEMSGLITGAEAKRLLSPEPAAAANGGEAAPAETPLSARAIELQHVLGKDTVLTQEKVQQAFDALGIPYSRSTFVDQMRAKVNRVQALPTLIQASVAAGKGEEAIKLQAELVATNEEVKALVQIEKTLTHYQATNWNAVESYYEAIESGNIPPDGAHLTDVIGAIQSGDDEAVLKAVGDPNKIKDVKRREMIKKLRKDAIKYGSIAVGINAAMIFLAWRKKEE